MVGDCACGCFCGVVFVSRDQGASACADRATAAEPVLSALRDGIPSADLFALSQRIQDLRPMGEDFRGWEGWDLQQEAALACGYTYVTDGRNEKHWTTPTGQYSQDPMPLCHWEDARKLLPINDRSLELQLSFSNDDCWPAISIRWWERDEADPKRWQALVVRGATEAACLTAAAVELRARDAQAIEAQQAETQNGSVHESAVATGDAPDTQDPPQSEGVR